LVTTNEGFGWLELLTMVPVEVRLIILAVVQLLRWAPAVLHR